MEEILLAAGRSRLLQGIPKEELSRVLSGLQARTADYKKDHYILHAGDHVQSLGLILSGQVMIVKEDVWGDRHILSSAGTGQCFAETFACVPESALGVSVVAQQPCRILFLNVARLLSAGSREAWEQQLVRNLLADMAAKNIAFTEKLNHLGQRSTRAKLLSYLSAQSQKQASVEFDIPFSRQQLADYLLVERSGLSAELCRMRDEGLLEFHKNHFVLKPEK